MLINISKEVSCIDWPELDRMQYWDHIYKKLNKNVVWKYPLTFIRILIFPFMNYLFYFLPLKQHVFWFWSHVWTENKNCLLSITIFFDLSVCVLVNTYSRFEILQGFLIHFCQHEILKKERERKKHALFFVVLIRMW